LAETTFYLSKLINTCQKRHPDVIKSHLAVKSSNLPYRNGLPTVENSHLAVRYKHSAFRNSTSAVSNRQPNICCFEL